MVIRCVSAFGIPIAAGACRGGHGNSVSCFVQLLAYTMVRNCVSPLKALVYSTIHRRLRRRQYRRDWIAQIQAAARGHGIRYAGLVYFLRNNQVVLNRKILSELVKTEPATSSSLLTWCARCTKVIELKNKVQDSE